MNFYPQGQGQGFYYNLEIYYFYFQEPTKSVKIMQEISELPITLEVIRHSQNIVQNLKKVC